MAELFLRKFNVKIPIQRKSFVAIVTGTVLTLSIIAATQLSALTEAYATFQIAPQNKIEPNRGSDHITPGKSGGQTTILSLGSMDQVQEGSTVEFAGKLVTKSGDRVKGATIVIIDYSASTQSHSNDKTFDRVDLAKAVTNSDGVYKATWIAKSKMSSDTITVFAQFGGNNKFVGSKKRQSHYNCNKLA